MVAVYFKQLQHKFEPSLLDSLGVCFVFGGSKVIQTHARTQYNIFFCHYYTKFNLVIINYKNMYIHICFHVRISAH